MVVRRRANASFRTEAQRRSVECAHIQKLTLLLGGAGRRWYAAGASRAGRRRVAIYHFQAKIISRGQGRGVVAAAAYRAAECLFDHELGRSQNYAAKTGVVHSEIMLPDGAPSRWRNRETLWNEVAAGEVRKDGEQRKSQLAREIEIALPRELSRAEAIGLAQDFVREQFVARGMVADLNVHWGTAADGEAQPHAHVLLTMRRVDPLGSRQERIDGRQAKRRRRHPGGSRGGAPDVEGDSGHDAGAGGGPDRNDHRGAGRDPGQPADDPDPAGHYRAKARADDGAAARLARLIAAARLRLGLQQHSVVAAAERAGFGLKERAWNDWALVGLWRARWAEMANARLAELGHDVCIDHRSNAARGLELEPQNKIGPAASRRARKGEDGERTAEHRATARRNGERLLAEPGLALRDLTQQHSTFTRADLARLVHRQSDGAEQFAAVMAKVAASPELVRVGEDGSGRARFSTQDLVQVERQLIAGAVALNKRTTHRVSDKRRTAALAGTQLSEEQHHAYLHVTRSRDLAVVVGIAGGGKSTMLGAARAVWAGQGYQVRGAALPGIAAEGLEGSAGIASRTIASWEYAWDQGRELLTANNVLVVDEAGMIGSRQLGRLMARVQRAGAKLVLVGDAEQLQAIEAGAAFRAIADQVGVIAITEPRRQQQEWQRQATKELATARSSDALRRYEAAGMVHRRATRQAARDGVVAGWDVARRQSPHASQIILTHERAEVRALNEAARAVRRAAGELGPDHALQAEAGLRSFAVGDRLYFLRNERGLGVKNGTLGTVERIEPGMDGARLTVRLDGTAGAGTGRAVSFDLAEYADIDHGYAATVHKSQGVTVDQAHVLATPGMDRHLTYVAMSRHRHAAQLHWGEDEFGGRLYAVLGRERAKDTTLDYAEPELDPVAAYAERRSLAPAMPPSEIVVRREAGMAPEPAAERYEDNADLSVLEGMEPPPGRRRPRDPVVRDMPSAEPLPSPAPPVDAPAPFQTAGRSARPKPAVRQRAARKAAPASARPTPSPERWPWTGLDDTPPASPLLWAEPYRPVGVYEIYAGAHDAVRSRRRYLEDHYARAYEDPRYAEARFTLLEAKLGPEAARKRVARHPGVLGALRGGWLTAEGRKDREQANVYARGVGAEQQDLGRAEEWARRDYAMAEERRRRREAIEVPGLSAKAQAAVHALADAGARPGWTPHELSERSGPVVETVLATAKVMSLYDAIRVDGPLLAELNRFGDAVARRLAYGGQVGAAPSSRQMPGAENQAEWLHGVLVAARARHAWHPTLQDYVAAHPGLKVRVEHAEAMRLLAARRAHHAPGRRPEPKPSPGPSFRPGM